MATRGRQFPSQVAATVPVPTTVETVVATTTVTTTLPGQRVQLEGQATILTGLNTTTVTARLRRGGLTGAQVGPAVTVTIAASTRGGVTVDALDQPAREYGGDYVLTLAQAGATSDGTAIGPQIRATVL